MPFKIDQNKNQNRSTDKVQNLGNERRYIYKDPPQESGQTNISYTRYPNKCFTQTMLDAHLCLLAVIISFMNRAKEQRKLGINLGEKTLT